MLVKSLVPGLVPAIKKAALLVSDNRYFGDHIDMPFRTMMTKRQNMMRQLAADVEMKPLDGISLFRSVMSRTVVRRTADLLLTRALKVRHGDDFVVLVDDRAEPVELAILES